MSANKSPFPDGELDATAELGAIDDRSVRVWVRQPGMARVQARMLVDGHEPVEQSVPLSDATDWTGVAVLTITEPAPSAPFTCQVAGRTLVGQLAPSVDAREAFTFAFGSCHRPFVTGKGGRIGFNSGAGLYPALATELRDVEARFMLLIGDQIYSDEIPTISVRDQLSATDARPPSLEEAVAAYRRVTRGYLAQTGFRRVRETVPTFWMWDDHDIFNNWGSRLHESPLDERLFEAATRVYSEYQNVRNPGGVIGPPPFFYSFRFGTVGFAVLDLRGARNYRVGRMMGAAQWNEFRRYLAGPEAAEVETLFVVSTVPIAHHSRWLVRLFSHLRQKQADDVRDRWCSPNFIQSRNELLDALFRWQGLRSERQVIVLSGDVHSASAFTIQKADEPGVIQQFTSSALSTPDTSMERFANVVGSRAPNLFEKRFRFRRRFLALQNNAGIVKIEPLEPRGHRVEFKVRAWDPKRGQLVDAGQVVAIPGTQPVHPGSRGSRSR